MTADTTQFQPQTSPAQWYCLYAVHQGELTYMFAGLTPAHATGPADAATRWSAEPITVATADDRMCLYRTGSRERLMVRYDDLDPVNPAGEAIDGAGPRWWPNHDRLDPLIAAFMEAQG